MQVHMNIILTHTFFLVSVCCSVLNIKQVIKRFLKWLIFSGCMLFLCSAKIFRPRCYLTFNAQSAWKITWGQNTSSFNEYKSDPLLLMQSTHFILKNTGIESTRMREWEKQNSWQCVEHASYILTCSRLKWGNHWQHWILSGRDLYFCVRRSPLCCG